MFIILYNIIGCIILIIGFPFILLNKKFRTGLSFRVGIYPANWKNSISSTPIIWIHAASLGELNAIKKIINGIENEFKKHKIIISTMTGTGYEKAVEEYGNKHFVIYAPIDIFFIINKSLNFFNPEILLIAETEIWPNLIIEAKKRNTKICIINGRLTAKSKKYYSLFNGLFDYVFECIDKYCVQNENEKKNFLDIKVKENKIVVCGQTKFDIDITIPEPEKRDLINKLGIFFENFLLVAGSTRPGEEEIIIEAFLEIKKIKSIKLIIAPRHTERISEIIKIIEQKNLSFQKLSDNKINNSADIFILDFTGKLLLYYSMASIAFVGGTLQNYGGHNLIEPALLSKPVIFGSYLDNVKDIAELLIRNGGGKCVSDKETLKKIILEYLNDPKKIEIDGLKAYEAVKKERGASERTLKEII